MVITGERVHARTTARERAAVAARAGAATATETGARKDTPAWSLVESVPWPGRSGQTIDLVAVGPGGVLVIERKDWHGTVDVVRGELRQSGFRRERECQIVVAAARALAATLPSSVRDHVRPVIALVNQPTPAEQPVALAAVGVADLDRLMSTLPALLDVTTVADLLTRLAAT